MTQVADWIKKLAMARQLRIQYEGAIYHLMSRGDRREEIFRDDLDRPDHAGQMAVFLAKALGMGFPF